MKPDFALCCMCVCTCDHFHAQLVSCCGCAVHDPCLSWLLSDGANLLQHLLAVKCWSLPQEVVPVNSPWKLLQQGTGAGGAKIMVMWCGGSLGSRKGSWHCSSCQQSVLSWIRRRNGHSLWWGLGSAASCEVRWCSLCRAGDRVPPLHCPSQFSGPWCCPWGAGEPCHEHCLPQLKEEFVGLGNGSVLIPPSPATVPVMDEGAPDVAEEFVQRWFLQIRLLQGG